MQKVFRWAVAVVATVVFGPLCLFGAFLVLSSGLGMLTNINLNPFDIADVSFLDWLFAGPGASPGDANFILQGIVGCVIGALAATPILLAWEWAKKEGGSE